MPESEEGFAEAVLELIKNPIPKKNVCGFAERFSWVHFGEKIVAAIGGE